MARACPSIQPWQSASSRAWAYVSDVGEVTPFFARVSQTPGETVALVASHDAQTEVSVTVRRLSSVGIFIFIFFFNIHVRVRRRGFCGFGRMDKGGKELGRRVVGVGVGMSLSFPLATGIPLAATRAIHGNALTEFKCKLECVDFIHYSREYM